MNLGKKRILFIGHVWPEPSSSAAGMRILQLIESCIEENYDVHFFCAAQKSEYSADLNSLGVLTEQIHLNDSSFNQQLEVINPFIVVFDRFMTEEQFGWRVQQVCPSALKVLDTEDLHFLRKSRQLAVKEQREINFDDYVSSGAKREIASILRCDVSLIISSVEMKLLQEEFNISSKLLYLLPMWSDVLKWDLQKEHTKGFHDRKNIVFIGNFLHDPNYDAVIHLKKNVWPLLRKQLKDVELHIWGAYCGSKVLQLHQPKEGFYVCGRADTLGQVFSSAKILIAPLRFGAGIKGKLIDAMYYGVPSVTTSIGAESMCSSASDWGGAIEDSIEGLIKATVELYSKEENWNNARFKGYNLLQKYFVLKNTSWLDHLVNVQSNMKKHRQSNFIGMLLSDEATQSLKYMSKWIEAKNRLEN
jgi:glycosyltransferase involved in cell wall biosynthesis